MKLVQWSSLPPKYKQKLGMEGGHLTFLENIGFFFHNIYADSSGVWGRILLSQVLPICEADSVPSGGSRRILLLILSAIVHPTENRNV